MKCEAEARTWKLRVWVDDAAPYGSPYEWCASMQLVRPGEVEIFGIDKPVTPQIHAAVKDELRRLGLSQYMIARYDANGQRREVWRRVSNRTGNNRSCPILGID